MGSILVLACPSLILHTLIHRDNLRLLRFSHGVLMVLVRFLVGWALLWMLQLFVENAAVLKVGLFLVLGVVMWKPEANEVLRQRVFGGV